MKVLKLAAVAAAGGAVGAGARALLTDVVASPEQHHRALAITLVINVVGCALLAALPTLALVRRSHTWSVFLGTGVLGGFTTMSTAIALPIAAVSPGLAVGYIALTLAGALLAVRLVDLDSTAAENAPLVDEDA